MTKRRRSVGIIVPTEYPEAPPAPPLVQPWAQRAEALGFDALWVGDHVVWNWTVLDSLSVLALLSGVTRTPVIGSAVFLLSLRHPVLAAKSLATVNYLSGGRLVFGIGVGGEHPQEFAACGVPLRERGRRTDEAMELTRGLLAGESTGHHGHFWDVPELDFHLSEGQAPPPMWIGGRSDAALRRTAARGDGWIGYLLRPDQFRSRWEAIEEYACRAGRNPADLTPSMLVFVSADEDPQRARRQAEDTLTDQFKVPFEKLKKYCVAGSPSQVAEGLEEYFRAGVRHLILYTMGEWMAQLEILGTEVLPTLAGSAAQPVQGES